MNALAIITMLLGICASLSFLFQAIRIREMHDVKNIALPTYAILFVTSFFWLMYGIYLRDIPLIASYSVGVLSISSVIVLYEIYKK